MTILEFLRVSTIGAASLAGASALGQTGYYGPLLHSTTARFPKSATGFTPFT